MSAIFDALQAAERGKVVKTLPSSPRASNRILLTPLSFGIAMSLVLFLGVDFYLAEISARRSIFDSVLPINDYVKSIVHESEMRERSETPVKNKEVEQGQTNKLAPIFEVVVPIQSQQNSKRQTESDEQEKVAANINAALPVKHSQPEARVKTITRIESPLNRRVTGPFETLKTIQALVGELKQTINRYGNGDEPDHADIQTRLSVDKKLRQLETRLSPDNLIVLRMRAYWLQKQGSLMAALSTYESILISHPDDMQASLNMVLLEMALGQNQTAMQRLSDLEFTYPDSSQLVKFRNQVVAHNGI